MEVVGIKFKEDGTVYNFVSEIKLKVGDKVIVETERGIQLGQVATTNAEKANNKHLKSVERLATEDDYEAYLKNLKASDRALKETKEEINKMGINMNLIDATFSLDKKQLLFNFISDERVDFRDLVKVLAAKYHARIELHQVGVRERQKKSAESDYVVENYAVQSALKI